MTGDGVMRESADGEWVKWETVSKIQEERDAFQDRLTSEWAIALERDDALRSRDIAQVQRDDALRELDVARAACAEKDEALRAIAKQTYSTPRDADEIPPTAWDEHPTQLARIAQRALLPTCGQSLLAELAAKDKDIARKDEALERCGEHFQNVEEITLKTWNVICAVLTPSPERGKAKD